MKTTLITIYVYVELSSLVAIVSSVLAMVILRGVNLPEEVAQQALWYFKAIIIFCGALTTLVGLVTIGYIMLH